SILSTSVGLTYLLILTLLEIVLGIDNIIFISIITDNLPKNQQKRARLIGLSLALIIRIIMLSLVSWIMTLDREPLFSVAGHPFTAHSLVLLIGGLFLIYKSVGEMHASVKGEHEEDKSKTYGTFSAAVTQIVVVDFIFSFDSVISAIGMTNDIQHEAHGNPLIIIVLAVLISMLVMMWFSGPISKFINERPTIKMIALSFLVAIGIMLIAEAFGEHLQKGYIYFALVYALIVEMLNLRMRKNQKK
ncbi:MAG: TerC family protein, partial [Flavobacteriales bacterium]